MVCDKVTTGGCSNTKHKLCMHLDVAPIDLMMSGVKHSLLFVGFRDLQQFQNAVVLFGQPDMVHYVWDHRAVADVVKGWDKVVFAKYNDGVPSTYSYDDSNQPNDPAAADRLN